MGCANNKLYLNSREKECKLKNDRIILSLTSSKHIAFEKANLLDINEDLTSVSQILMEFIHRQKLFYIKAFFEILLNVVEILDNVLDKREELGMKFFVVNFDNFFYDRNRNIIVLQEENIFRSNYDFQCLITKCNFKYNDKKLKSIQPLIYDNEANELFIKLKLCQKAKFSHSNCRIFYSFLFFNFLNKVFRKSAVTRVKNVIETYDDFRRKLCGEIKAIFKEKEKINLEMVKILLTSVITERAQIQQILYYYESEYSVHSLRKSIEPSSYSSECPISEFYKSKQFHLYSSDSIYTQTKTCSETIL